MAALQPLWPLRASRPSVRKSSALHLINHVSVPISLLQAVWLHSYSCPDLLVFCARIRRTCSLLPVYSCPFLFSHLARPRFSAAGMVRMKIMKIRLGAFDLKSRPGPHCWVRRNSRERTNVHFGSLEGGLPGLRRTIKAPSLHTICNGVYSLKWRLTDRYLRWGTLAHPRPGRAEPNQYKSSAFQHELRISGFPHFSVSTTCLREKLLWIDAIDSTRRDSRSARRESRLFFQTFQPSFLISWRISTNEPSLESLRSHQSDGAIFVFTSPRERTTAPFLRRVLTLSVNIPESVHAAARSICTRVRLWCNCKCNPNFLRLLCLCICHE